MTRYNAHDYTWNIAYDSGMELSIILGETTLLNVFSHSNHICYMNEFEDLDLNLTDIQGCNISRIFQYLSRYFFWNTPDLQEPIRLEFLQDQFVITLREIQWVFYLHYATREPVLYVRDGSEERIGPQHIQDYYLLSQHMYLWAKLSQDHSIKCVETSCEHIFTHASILEHMIQNLDNLDTWLHTKPMKETVLFGL